MATPTADRVKKHRDALRAAGMRPVQIWVADTRPPGFAGECARQAALAASADRQDVEPSPENGSRRAAQVMIDKPMTICSDRIGTIFGRLDDATMVRANRSLALFLGLAG